MRKSIQTFLCFMFFCVVLSAGENTLDKALMLLSQSKTDGCGICAEEEAKKAMKLLDQYFRPGQIIKTSDGNLFSKNDECGNNEFVLTGRPARSNVSLPDGSEGIAPLVTYRIHTDNDHLSGVEKKDYTGQPESRPFMKVRSSSSWRGAGSFEIIKYPYGDGACYIYYPRSNKVQVQCRVIAVTAVK